MIKTMKSPRSHRRFRNVQQEREDAEDRGQRMSPWRRGKLPTHKRSDSDSAAEAAESKELRKHYQDDSISSSSSSGSSNRRTLSLSDMKKVFKDAERKKKIMMEAERGMLELKKDEQDNDLITNGFGSPSVISAKQSSGRAPDIQDLEATMSPVQKHNGAMMSPLEHISRLDPILPGCSPARRAHRRTRSLALHSPRTKMDSFRTPRAHRNTGIVGSPSRSNNLRQSMESVGQSSRDAMLDLVTTREETDGFVRGMRKVEELNRRRSPAPSARRQRLRQSSLFSGRRTMDEEDALRLSPSPDTGNIMGRSPERSNSQLHLISPERRTGLFPALSTPGSRPMSGTSSSPSMFTTQSEPHAHHILRQDMASLTSWAKSEVLGDEEDVEEDGSTVPLQFDPARLHYDNHCLEPLRLQYDPGQVKSINVKNTNTVDIVIRDYKMMAAACRRAGRTRMEGQCHYKLGSLYESKLRPTPAIRHYKSFLGISRAIADDSGICLALNCLGVLYHKLGGRHLETAFQYHKQHWEMADSQGKVVAYINIGLTLRDMENLEAAAENFKMAFQCAVDMGDKQGESIALANLGLLGMSQGDTETAQACIERHIELSRELDDEKSVSEAYHTLGQLAIQKGEHSTALDMLERGRHIAISSGDQSTANKIKVHMGIINGQVQFEQYMRQIAK